MDDIYREQLMEHYKHPMNKGDMDTPSKNTLKKNPLCGDVLSMQLKIDDGVIKDIKFNANACAVTVASASILTEEVKGKSIEEVKKMTKEDLLSMLGVELTTSRVKCATLALEALQGMLEDM